jgi:NAD(P)-dependent dehydrogenase (short-subunit alcohol dehydrogenase family)
LESVRQFGDCSSDDVSRNSEGYEADAATEMKLKRKVAIITGSTSGIGRTTAILFSQEGARVVVVGRRSEAGQITVKEIKKKGGEALFVKADISDVKQVKDLVKKTLSAYDKIDILFNNAGIHPESARKPLAECSLRDWDRIMRINAKGIFLGCKYAIPRMIENGGGVIINTSSTHAFVTIKNRGIYSASKGAITTLTKAMAIDYAPYHIRVNCICPGMVQSEMTSSVIQEARRDKKVWQNYMAKYPLGRLGKPEDIAYAALFLASDESSWITGSCLMVDGGYTAQ